MRLDQLLEVYCVQQSQERTSYEVIRQR